MKTFVIGDIHGAHKALIQCLKRSKFDKENDILITLGDVVDGWHETYNVVEELLTIKNRIDIRGNHDAWFIEYLNSGISHDLWLTQGGQATIDSYLKAPVLKLTDHRKFFDKQHYYYIDDSNRLFVHGGYDYKIPFKENSKEELMWDRHLFEVASQWEAHMLTHPTEPKSYFKEFKEIFVGHTTTYSVGWRFKREDKPLHFSNLWNLDTGAGWFGRLTIMDVESKEYWQSDPVQDLYPNEFNARK